MEKRLYVGNLSYNSTEGDVLELFQQAGTVVSCHLMLDKFTSRSRGFAFVEMETVEEANGAVFKHFPDAACITSIGVA